MNSQEIQIQFYQMEHNDVGEKSSHLWECLPVNETHPDHLVDSTLTIFKDTIYLFGGFSTEQKGVTNKLWCWKNGVWFFKILEGISPRRSHSAVRRGDSW